MSTQDLEKWNKARIERDANIERADRDRAERALEEQRARTREAEEMRRAEAAHRQKVHALRLSVLEFIRCANDLRVSGSTHLYEVAHLAAIAATESMHMGHPISMGDQIYAFTTWFADWTNMSAGRS